MATYSRIPLSGSTNGKLVPVVATATAGTLIHTATSSTTYSDEIWIYAVNSSTSAVKLTLEWGGVTANTDHIELTISPEAGLVLVSPGISLQNSLVVRAFAATACVINLAGYVNRIS
jgi:archaellin